MRTKPIVSLTQEENITFFVEKKANYGYYNANFWELIIPVEGTVEYTADGKRKNFTRGTVAFIGPEVTRRVTIRGVDGQYVAFRIMPEYISGIFDIFEDDTFEVFTRYPFHEMKISEGHLSDIMHSLEGLYVASADEKKLAYKKLMLTIFMPIIPYHEYDGEQDVTHRAIAAMNNVKNISLRLPDIAAQVGCSEEYLVRCFKKSGKETPNTMFKRIKLRYAKNLLTSTKISVADVANMIGFRSVGHFNKLYYLEYGVNPGADKTRS